LPVFEMGSPPYGGDGFAPDDHQQHHLHLPQV
jgi:hypothetical protein